MCLYKHTAHNSVLCIKHVITKQKTRFSEANQGTDASTKSACLNKIMILHNHAAEAACQTTTVTDVTVIQDGDLSILA